MEDILLIDDDVELCSMLTDYLGRYGFRVSAIHRGDTGLAEALKKQHMLILLDVARLVNSTLADSTLAPRAA